jgi:Peptidase S46
MSGVFERSDLHKNQAPFDLPKSWLAAKPQVKLDTPLNFVSTADIIGGNSGSPVVNRDGRFVGIVFDGNPQSLPWDYAFDERQGRALAVDVRGILEALRNVYHATNVVTELTQK